MRKSQENKKLQASANISSSYLNQMSMAHTTSYISNGLGTTAQQTTQ